MSATDIEVIILAIASIGNSVVIFLFRNAMDNLGWQITSLDTQVAMYNDCLTDMIRSRDEVEWPEDEPEEPLPKHALEA